jgi:hypothetical protein
MATPVDSWSNGLGVRQPPADKDVSRETEDIVGIRYQETTSEDYNRLKLSVCCSEKLSG